MRILAEQGYIEDMKVDAIVNAANSELLRGGGVCGAIYDAAGPELEEITDMIGECRTGDAVITPGFDLPATWIVHAVGPIWYEDLPRDHMVSQLRSTYASAIREADAFGVETIAFPAISTGIYGFPADLAAATAVETLSNLHPENVKEVVLVAHSDKSLNILKEALNNANIPTL